MFNRCHWRCAARRVVRGLSVASVLALAGVAAPVQAQSDPSASLTSGTLTIDPFVSLSGNADDVWIGRGIAETLSVDLGRVDTMGPGTGRWLVRGAYQRLNDSLEISAELVDMLSGDTLGTITLDGTVSNLFALQDELGLRLVELMGQRRTPGVGAGRAMSEESRPQSGLERRPGVAGLAVTPGPVIDGPPPPTLPNVVARDSLGRATMRAFRLTRPLRVDGQLDEPVYEETAGATDFVQQEPDEGGLATDQTEVWVLFDDDTIYISARCWSEEPDRIVANEMKRDSPGVFGNETFAVVLDTFYDRRNGFNFITNALGVIFDATITNERTPNLDWNAVWDVKTARVDQGWTLEMAIPFKSLRFPSGDSPVWGINFQRRVASKNEVSFLTPIPASLSFTGMFKLSSAATLVGLEMPTSGTRLELKPYLISDLTTDLTETPEVVNALAGDAGFDVKYGVTDGLTADFTYSTDFAQAEVDEQQVNLTRFSLFFPEKREFFLEGQGIFDFGGGQRPDPTTFFFSGERFGGAAPVMFFSRRIGLDDGRAVPIRAGGRLTGKAGPYSIGVLNVQTGEDLAAEAVPTNFSVMRVKRDVLRRSAVGALFTGRSVSLEGSGASQMYGADGTFSFYDNVNINTHLARTQTPGISGDDISYQTELDFNGDRWGLVLDRLSVGENFNPEVGFVRRDDFRRNSVQARFSPRPQSVAWVRKLLFQGSLDYTTDGRGVLETRIQQGLVGIELENGDRIFAGATDNYELIRESFDISNELTIPPGAYSFVNTRVVYALAQQRVVAGGLTFDRGGFFGGNRTSVGYFRGRLGITPQLTVEPSVSLNWFSMPQGDFRTDLVAARTTYTLTPRMFVAALLQYNSSIDALVTNLRFRWEYQPGSELFVVYTDQRDTFDPRAAALENRAFVVKATRLIRF